MTSLANSESSPNERTALLSSVEAEAPLPYQDTISPENAPLCTVKKPAVTEEGGLEGDGASDPENPYLSGVSVTRFWVIFGFLLATFFTSCLDLTIMVSSHPVITSYFHSSNAASWLSTAFLLTYTSFQPIFGRLSDSIGRKGPYIFCIVVFTISTVWCGLAQSMTSFIVARAVCGLGAGGMGAMSSIITSDLVPIELRGTYQSYINVVFGLGTATGAAIGGVIADRWGWRMEFIVQIPVLLLCLVGSWVSVPADLGLAEGMEQKSLIEAMKIFDFQGSITLTISLIFLILGLNLGGNIFPWSHPFIIASLVMACVTLPLFIWAESRVKLPIMPLGLLIKNPHASLVYCNTLGSVIVNAIMFNAPLYFQAVKLESATASGLRLVAPYAAASIIGTATGFFITYTRRLKLPLVAGCLFFILGTAGLAGSSRPGAPDWVPSTCLILFGMAQGFMFPGTFVAVLAVSRQAEQAVVTSTLILWRSLGNVLGVAGSSLVVQNVLRWTLEARVHGPARDAVIDRVRKSVAAIVELGPPYQGQVMAAYAEALQATFIMATVLSVVALGVILPVRLPRLATNRK